MKHLGFSQTYRRFFLLFLLFAVLISVLFIPLYVHSYRITRQSTLEQMQHVMNNGITMVDAAGTAIINTYLSSASDSDFHALSALNGPYEDSPLTLLRMCQALHEPFLAFDTVRDVGIVFSDTIAITRQRSFYSPIVTLYPLFLSCGEMSFEAWYALIADTEVNGAWLPAQAYHSTSFGSYAALTYVHKWRRTTSAANTPVVFYATLDCGELTKLLADESILEEGYLRITDASGNLLYESSTPGPDEQAYAKLNGQSLATQFNIEVGVSNRYVFQQIQSLFTLYLYQLCLLVVVTLVLVFFFSRKSSQPMHVLLNTIDEMGLAPEDGAPVPETVPHLTGDYSTVASSIRNLNDQLKISADIINEQEVQLQNHLFFKALMIGLYSAEDIRRFQRLFPNFPEHYRIVRFHIDRKDIPKDVNPFSTVLKTAENAGWIPYFYYYIGYSTMLCLSADMSMDKVELDSMCEQASQSVGARFDCLVTQVHSSIEALPMAYQQLQFYSVAAREDEGVFVIGENDAIASPHFLPINYPLLHEIFDALSVGKDAHACAILSGINNQLFSSSSNPSTLQHVYTMLYDMIVQLKIEYSDKLGAIRLPVFDEASPAHLFSDELPACFCQIGTLMRERIDKDNSDARVLRFVNNNLYSPDLCLNFVSEHLNMPIAAVQSVMKTNTGATFLAYVGDKRIEHACVLLKDKMPVQEVSSACGFSSPNSFYKAFRRKYGVSPSSYVDQQAIDGTPDSSGEQ